MTTYTDFEGLTREILSHEDHLAASAARPILLGAGPALPVGTPGPRRAAAPTDADILAALMASPDFVVFGR